MLLVSLSSRSTSYRHLCVWTSVIYWLLKPCIQYIQSVCSVEMSKQYNAIWSIWSIINRLFYKLAIYIFYISAVNVFGSPNFASHIYLIISQTFFQKNKAKCQGVAYIWRQILFHMETPTLPEVPGLSHSPTSTYRLFSV